MNIAPQQPEFNSASNEMKCAVSQHLRITLTFFSISRQHQRSFFHTTPQFIRQLQDSGGKNFALALHADLLKCGFLCDIITSNHLLSSYVRLQKIDRAHQLFDEISEPNVVSWTSLMAGYVGAHQPKMALWLFTKMLRSTVWPNAFTFSTVINACSILTDVKSGKSVHARVELCGLQTNLVVCTSLVDMYGKSSNVESARRVFDSMIERNVVSWTSMITGYAQNAQGYDALNLFKEFHLIGSDPPNQFMLASVISSCASLGRLVYGEVTHAVVIRRGHESNEVVASALIDMYAKCGCIAYSDMVFRQISNPSVIPYTSMIIGYAKYGFGRQATELFHAMLRRNIEPNDITCLGFLYACSHSGLVDQGLEHLHSMQAKYGVTPDARHYTCAVDILSRRGRLDEAYRIAKSIDVGRKDQGALLWGTLLSTSRLHGRVDIAAEASKWLMESNQQVASAYVTMSNTYAVAGKWDDAQSIRSEMRYIGIQKEPGCSWVEIKDSVCVFYAGDLDSCPRGSEVLSLLKELGKKMKEKGYVAESNGLVFVDVEEEAGEEIVSLHSERLALRFSLISMPKGVTVRIMKNLRMCRGCHEVFKLISDIVDRDFVVRDVNRFHHFINGSCSCKDFW